MKQTALLFIVLLLPLIVFSTEINTADSIPVGSVWSVDFTLTGDFDKAVILVDSSKLITAYYVSQNDNMLVDDAAVDYSKVSSYNTQPTSIILALYPLAEGTHTIDVSLYRDSDLVNEQSKTIEFIGTKSSITEKLDELIDEVDSMSRELGRMRARDTNIDKNVSLLENSLVSVRSEISGLKESLSQKADNASLSEAQSTLTTIGNNISAITKQIEALSMDYSIVQLKQQEYDNERNNGLFATAFVVMGNAVFPIALIIGLVILFFIFNFVKGKLKKDKVNDESGFPEPEEETGKETEVKGFKGKWASD